MRSSNKSRSRNKNNNRRPTGNVMNRVFDSSGPEGKVRGTPQQIIEKYNMLARDAQLSGDRVAAENFQQHAEHYTRLLGEAMREQQERREAQDAQRQRERDDRDDGNDRGDDNDRGARADRQDRNDREDRNDGPRNRDRERERPAAMSGEAAVVDLDGGEDSGLVETPENNRKPPRRRSPKPKASDQANEAGVSTGDAQPDAAE